MVAGTGLMAGTAAGLLLSVQVALFGFRDSLGGPYAGVSLVEFGGAGLLLADAGLTLAARRFPAGRGSGIGHTVPRRSG